MSANQTLPASKSPGGEWKRSLQKTQRWTAGADHDGDNGDDYVDDHDDDDNDEISKGCSEA